MSYLTEAIKSNKEPVDILVVTIGSNVYYWTSESFTDDEVPSLAQDVESRIVNWGEVTRGISQDYAIPTATLSIDVDNTDGFISELLTSKADANKNIYHCTATLVTGFIGLDVSLWEIVAVFTFADFDRNTSDNIISLLFRQKTNELFGAVERTPKLHEVFSAVVYDGPAPTIEMFDKFVPILYGNFSGYESIRAMHIADDCVYAASGLGGALYVIGMHPVESTVITPGFEWDGAFNSVPRGTGVGQVQEYWVSVTHRSRAYKLLIAIWHQPPPITEEYPYRNLDVRIHLKGSNDTSSPEEVSTPPGICESIIENFTDAAVWDTLVDTASMTAARTLCKNLGLSVNWVLNGPNKNAVEMCARIFGSVGFETYVTKAGKFAISRLDPSNEELLGSYANAFKFDETNIDGFEEWYARKGERWEIVNMLNYSYGKSMRNNLAGPTGWRFGIQPRITQGQKDWHDNINGTQATDATRESVDRFDSRESDADFPAVLNSQVAKRIADAYVAKRLAYRLMMAWHTDDLRVATLELGSIIKVKHDASISASDAYKLCRIEEMTYDPEFKRWALLVADVNDIVGGGYFILGNEDEWEIDTGSITVDLTQNGPDVDIDLSAAPSTPLALGDLIQVNTALNKKTFRITVATTTTAFTAEADTCTNETTIADADWKAMISYNSAGSRGTTALDSNSYATALTHWGHLCDESSEQFTGGDEGKWLKDEVI